MCLVFKDFYIISSIFYHYHVKYDKIYGMGLGIKLLDKYTKITFLDLIGYTLLDSFELSAHSFGDITDDYELNGIGISFTVSFDEDEIISHIKNINAKNIIFAHIHPLLNEASLKFEKDKKDPRIEIAEGKISLPIGEPPTPQDIDLLAKIKNRNDLNDVDISGAVFSSGGIWTFNSTSTYIIGTKIVYPTIRKDFDLDEENIKIDLPSYFRETKKPETRYKKGLRGNPFVLCGVAIGKKSDDLLQKKENENNIKIIEKIYSEAGVNLNYIPYISYGINPINVMRKILDEWKTLFIDNQKENSTRRVADGV